VSQEQQGLFPQLLPARNGNGRKAQRLFVPKLLLDASKSTWLDDHLDEAHAIVCKWADLETSGKLAQKKERTLQGEFLGDVMGRALGYTVFSDGLENWNLEAAFALPGGEADAAIGRFAPGDRPPPRVLIELKGPKVNIDRDRFDGRTPVQQVWDYLNEVPDCPWAIVSNIVSFRLYHRTKTTRAYEHFKLQDLRNKDRFREFYCLFERGGFLPALAGQKPRCDDLLERSEKRQREVGADLYKLYHEQRIGLINYFRRPPHKFALDQAIHVAQKLLDRIIFIAFCEDRRLLPSGSINETWGTISKFTRVENPKWQNFKGLFEFVDKGNSRLGINAYNGELFKPNLIDQLELDDSWTNLFKEIADYDFDTEINVDVLGHLFEQSINDLELLRGTHQPEAQAREGDAPAEPPDQRKPGRRKREGVYYTPRFITKYIVEQAVGRCLQERYAALAAELKLDPATPPGQRTGAPWAKYHSGCYDILRALRICDPACGSGAFLIEAFDYLEGQYELVIDDLIDAGACTEAELDKINPTILHENLFGVDLSPEAVEITKLALWIRTAELGKPLSSLTDNIKCGNSVVSDPAVHEKAFNWQAAFPSVFEQGGFDAVIGNPPYIRQEWIAAYKPYWERAFKSYHGVADIFTYFFERGVEILRDGGRLGFITSGSWVRGNFGAPLRKFLADSAAIESMIDFGEFQPFQDAEMIRPSITIANKSGERRLMRLFKWLVAGRPPEELSAAIATAPTMTTAHLGEDAWELEADAVLALLNKLRSVTPILGEYTKGQILRGVVTGANDVFVIDEELRNRLIKQDRYSTDLIKPFVQGTHLRPWYIEESHDYLIFTRRGTNIDDYPAIREYLQEHRKELEPRPPDLPASANWAGRKPGVYEWFEIQDTVDYWEGFEKDKIVWPDISKLPRFSMDTENRFLGNTGFVIPLRDYYLLGVLSSWATWFFISKTAQPLRLRGDRWQYRLFAQFMEQVPIPRAKKAESAPIAALAKKCGALGKTRYELQTKIQKRLIQGFGESLPGVELGVLNEKAQEWWETPFNDLGAALKTSFKLTANPFKNPKTADEWEPYLTKHRAEVQKLSSQLADAEAEINDRVYRLFHLTPDEIKLLQREVEH
jgi:hypothetical protein